MSIQKFSVEKVYRAGHGSLYTATQVRKHGMQYMVYHYGYGVVDQDGSIVKDEVYHLKSTAVRQANWMNIELEASDEKENEC